MDRHKCNRCIYLDTADELLCKRYSASIDIIVNCIAFTSEGETMACKTKKKMPPKKK